MSGLCDTGLKRFFDKTIGIPNVGIHSYRIFNIGNNRPVMLSEYITQIEKALGMVAVKEYLPLQPGDVPDTFADSFNLYSAIDYKPITPVAEGISSFVQWYRSYYSI